MCKVSIIVPVYNGENDIENCIKKLLEQTFNDIEIIIINDGSTDGTAKVCEQLHNIDSRVKVYYQENAGPSSARNLGLKVAEGEWIVFVDADDWLEKEGIEIVYDIAQRENADIVLWNLQNEQNRKIVAEIPFFDIYKVFEGKDMDKLIHILFTDVTETKADSLNIKAPYCKLIKKEIIGDSYFPENINLGEDVCFAHQIFDKCKKLVYINNIFYHRIINDDSLSQKEDVERGKRRIKYTNWVINYRKNYDKNIVNTFVYKKYREIAVYYFSANLRLSYKLRKEQIKEFLDNLNWNIDYTYIPNDKYLFLLKNNLYFVMFLYCKMINLLRPVYQSLKLFLKIFKYNK